MLLVDLSLSLKMDSDCSYHYTDNFLIDPYEEELKEEKRRRKEMEKMKQHSDMVGFVADGQYGIPRRCPCGSRYFTCTKFKDDGLHFRQPWVFGVEQEIEKLVMKVEKQSKTIEEMRKQIQIQAEEIAKLKT
ncbi:unnamed protein product [Thlaspi arvense]|uniref:Uncharacterized protein n=1 Tax=Thlaspi arvense TaxID=13288 RepID=A0AAU9RVH2_THLAR|nr:unnamed protein product [Thlaspi arvense]